MTPTRSTPDPAGAGRVLPFPIFRAVIAPDGTSATLNGQQVRTAGFADLFTAVHAAAATAAAHLGTRPIRMDLTTPTGQVRHLTAHPSAAGPSVTDPPVPGHAGPPAYPAPLTPVVNRIPTGDTDQDPDRGPHRSGDSVSTPPTTPPSPRLNGATHHQRLTPLDDPMPHELPAATAADTRPPPPVQSEPEVETPPPAPVRDCKNNGVDPV